MTAQNEPQAMAVDLLSQVLNYIKQSTPTRSDDTSTLGYVYSVLRVGQMISPHDFALPWSPIGGSPAAARPVPQPAPTDVEAKANDAAAKAAAQENTKRALNATLNVEILVDDMLMVTDDGTFQRYQGGRHLGFIYNQILQAMEAPPEPPRSADDQKRIDAARAVLWAPDQTPTPLYSTYLANQRAYAQAQADFTAKSQQLLASADPDTAPLLLQPAEVAVDQARDQWKAQGADEVEAALATVESLGVPLEQGAIKAARDLMLAWSIPVINVAGAKQPYSFVLPSDWAAFDVDNVGWTHLTIDSSHYNEHFDSFGNSVMVGGWRGESESTAGSAGLSVGGFGFNGHYSEADASRSGENTATASDGTTFHNDASDMSISLEYGLCAIARPWLITDIFRMQNWFLTGQKAGSISTGTISNQVADQEKLMPMIPTHFLVIRNVTISASNWGTDGDTLNTYFGSHKNSSEEHSSTVGGGVEIPVWGALSLDAGASHSESGFSGSYQDEAGHTHSNNYKASFDGTTLTVQGAQIVAWLSEIVPKSPPLDDPKTTTA